MICESNEAWIPSWLVIILQINVWTQAASLTLWGVNDTGQEERVVLRIDACFSLGWIQLFIDSCSLAFDALYITGSNWPPNVSQQRQQDALEIQALCLMYSFFLCLISFPPQWMINQDPYLKSWFKHNLNLLYRVDRCSTARVFRHEI